MRRPVRIPALVAALAFPLAAQANFHFMQIEQVTGGVGGDVTQQAIQLRLRLGGQNQVQFSRVVVRDATGANPVTLIDIGNSVPNFQGGARVLLVTPAFATAQDPSQDFVLTNAIPTSYYAGGKLTFEADGGTLYYSLCWGTYSGPTTGSTDNDDNGTYGPCVQGPLPYGSTTALRFTGAASALGTTNAADYALIQGATFTNNAGVSAALVAPPEADLGGDCDDDNAAIYRGQVETLSNRLDDDCDGLADELADDTPSSDTGDLDGDGESIASGDCNDNRILIGRTRTEVFGNRLDDDCDGLADEDANNGHSPVAVDFDSDGRAMFDLTFRNGFE